MALRTAVLAAIGAGCESDPVIVRCSDDAPADQYGLSECGTAKVRRAPVTVCQMGTFPTGIGECVSDADCAEDPGTVCYCGPLGNLDRDPNLGMCTPAECTTSADCGAGHECVVTEEPSACTDEATVRFVCTSDVDECVGEEECGQGESCIKSTGEALNCVSAGECGRPFLVGGVERTAAPVRRSDWAAEPTGEPSNVATCDRRADFWLRTATLEHASVAAFARFILELLALGAPSDLVTAASTAMADEIRHAELAYGLASRFGGSPVGPGPLALTGALDGVDPSDVAERLFHEGCVGETVAAVLAGEAAAVETYSAARDALLQIERDETTHALLAWRALAWMLQAHPASRLGFERALAVTAGERASNEEARLRDAVIREVVLTAAAPLLGAIAPSAGSVVGRASC